MTNEKSELRIKNRITMNDNVTIIGIAGGTGSG